MYFGNFISEITSLSDASVTWLSGDLCIVIRYGSRVWNNLVNKISDLHQRSKIQSNSIQNNLKDLLKPLKM